MKLKDFNSEVHLKLIYMADIKAKEFKVSDSMSLEPITMGEDGVLSEALGLMESEDVHEIPIVKGEKVLGLLTLGNILKRGKLQPKTKVKSLMSHPPKITPDMSLINASRVLLDNGFRGCPVVGGKLLLGFISRGDILSKIPEMVDLRITAEEIMSEPVVTIMEHQPLISAKEVLRDMRVRALPVVDENGKLAGILTQSSVAKAFAIPWVRAQHGDIFGDKIERGVEVRSLMDPPVWVEKTSPVSDIPDILESAGSCVVVEGLVPMGIVTPKDLLELVAREGREEQKLMVQILGLENEDDITLELAYDTIHRYVKKIARYVEPESITVSANLIDKGGKPYYELTCRMLYEGKASTNKEEGWELLPTLRELMKELVKIHKRR